MCIFGFLQLRLLRYKNKRENRNLIAKNDSRMIKIWFLPVKIAFDSDFL